MKAIVSEKGQVTIPKPLRERMGIRPGQVLDFREERGRLVVSKRIHKDRVDQVLGILNQPGSTDEWITALRGEPEACDPPPRQHDHRRRH